MKPARYVRIEVMLKVTQSDRQTAFVEAMIGNIRRDCKPFLAGCPCRLEGFTDCLCFDFDAGSLKLGAHLTRQVIGAGFDFRDDCWSDAGRICA